MHPASVPRNKKNAGPLARTKILTELHKDVLVVGNSVLEVALGQY